MNKWQDTLCEKKHSKVKTNMMFIDLYGHNVARTLMKLFSRNSRVTTIWYIFFNFFLHTIHDNKFRKYVAHETTILEDKFKCLSTLKSH